MATTVNKGYKDAQIINESPRSNYIYKDLNLFFTKHPMSSDVSKVTDVQAIKRSIRNLILTNKGERLFHPYGLFRKVGRNSYDVNPKSYKTG